MSEGAKFAFSLSEGKLEITGTELFVMQQVEAFKDVIVDAFRQSNVSPVLLPRFSNAPTAGAQATMPEVDVEDATVSNPFPRVLDVLNDKVKITRSIKGSTTSEKSIKLILIYLWGKETLLRQTTAEFKELRDLCEQYACLDSGNFASTLSSKKNLIVVDGSKGSSSKVCKLTYPGREKAEEYLREMNEV
jgi:hypothetical protein